MHDLLRVLLNSVLAGLLMVGVMFFALFLKNGAVVLDRRTLTLLSYNLSAFCAGQIFFHSPDSKLDQGFPDTGSGSGVIKDYHLESATGD